MPVTTKKPVASAAVDESKSRRPPAVGPTVKLRATQRGQYGRPTADLIDAGTVFPMAIKDLESYDAAIEVAKALKDDSRREARIAMLDARETITIDGRVYLLPTWCEDARNPVAAAAVQERAEDEGPSRDDDVI